MSEPSELSDSEVTASVIVQKTEQQGTCFNSGKLIVVNQDTFRAGSLLATARITCLRYTDEADPLLLSKILAEINECELGLQLALAHGVSPAHVLSILLFHLKEGGNDYACTLNRAMPLIPNQFLPELAQSMIAYRLALPEPLQQKLVELKQVSHVVGSYLSEEVFDIVKALNFVTEHKPIASRVLVETDVN